MGFEKLNIRKIVGRAEPDNMASFIVLENCGRAYSGKSKVNGHLVKTYEIYNPWF
jgi:RimJ/RimL family protein N-acetyltransferase